MRSLEEDTIRFLEMGAGGTIGFAIAGLVLGLLGFPNAYLSCLAMILGLWLFSPLFYHLMVRRAHHEGWWEKERQIGRARASEGETREPK